MVPYANNIRCLQPDVDCKHWLIFVENEKISEDMSSAACVCVVCFDEIKCGKNTLTTFMFRDRSKKIGRNLDVGIQMEKQTFV